MTVSSTTRKAGPYTRDGIATVYGFAFKVFAAADVLVVGTPLSTGVDTTLTLGVDYTIALNADQNASPGGNVTMLAVGTAGDLVTLTSQVSNTQGTSIPNASGFYSLVVEAAFDRVTILVQQALLLAQRGLTLPLSSNASTNLPNPVANNFLGWNSAANAIINYAGVASSAVSAAMQAIVASSTTQAALALFNYLAGFTGAVVRTLQSKLQERISVLDFGADSTGVADSTAAFIAAADYANSIGGGRIFVPPGTYITPTGITLGNGSNAAVSTKHNKIVFYGAGMGSSTGVTNQQVNGASKIKYTGSSSPSTAVVSFAGPMYGIGLEDIELDCNSLAGIGVSINHVTQATFRKVSCRNYTAIGWSLTTRTGFPSGCAFGCADNRFYDCYGFLDSSVGTGTVLGISLNSGVSTAVSLVGQPDSARNVFIGGTYEYGQSATSYGAWLSGADNNSMLEVEFYPYNGTTSGFDVYLNQWPASGNFPLENYFANLGMTKGVSGNGGVGSSWGNTFYPFPTSDGAGFPALTGASGGDHQGMSYVAGTRAYRGRQASTATLNSSTQSNSTTTPTNVPGLSVTLTTLASTKLRVSFSGRATKATTGIGYFTIAINGSAQGDTRTDVNNDGFWHAVSGEGLYSVGAGSQTITVQFTSGDTNAIQISHGTLVVQELY